MSDERAAAMAERGEFTCPGWCAQPADEHADEAHQGEWADFATSGGEVVRVRPIASWDDQASDRVELRTPAEDLRLTESDWSSIESLVVDAQIQLDGWRVYSPPQSWVWAYDGAETDYAGQPDGDPEDDEDEEELVCDSCGLEPGDDEELWSTGGLGYDGPNRWLCGACCAASGIDTTRRR